jgi:hypothetical protein
MNDYQEEKHTSNKLVVKVANENPEATKLIPDFEDGIKKLDVINKEVEKVRTLQEEDKSGVTDNKHYTLDNLRESTLDVGGAVHSYGSKKKDVPLMGKVNFKAGKLSGMVPGKIIAAANTTLEEAKKIPAEDLAKAGITAAELTEYEALVTYFKTVSAAPREAQVEVSAYTKRLAVLFAESRELFRDSLDKLARQFKKKAPSFYVLYRGARKTIHRSPNDTDDNGGSTPGGAK